MIELASTHWDGNEPTPGDIILHAEHGVLEIVHLARGAGIGQYRLWCLPVDRQVFEWV